MPSFQRSGYSKGNPFNRTRTGRDHKPHNKHNTTSNVNDQKKNKSKPRGAVSNVSGHGTPGHSNPPLPNAGSNMTCRLMAARRCALGLQTRAHRRGLVRPHLARQLGVVQAACVAQCSCSVGTASPFWCFRSITAVATAWWCSLLRLVSHAKE
jgi:hypothetical protein